MAINTDTLPFPLQHALNEEQFQNQHGVSQTETAPNTQISHVPGQPSVSLSPSDVHAFLTQELHTPVLDELYPRLWWVGRKDSQAINPLNRQRVKGWDIVATEDPNLHLIRQGNKMHIKPVPLCFLNHDFWNIYLAPSSTQSSVPLDGNISNRAAAMGFMRSYSHLIQHRLDFILAQKDHLLPSEIEWIEWSKFITHFRHIDDSQVASRYHYGQLRLSRLNWAVRIFQPRNAPSAWFYKIPYWSTASYLESVIGPLIFVFASLSVVLSSMQVVLSVPSEGLWSDGYDSANIRGMRQAFWVFSIMMILLSGVVWTLIIVVPVSVLIWQLHWGFRNRGLSRKRPSC